MNGRNASHAFALEWQARVDECLLEMPSERKEDTWSTAVMCTGKACVPVGSFVQSHKHSLSHSQVYADTYVYAYTHRDLHLSLTQLREYLARPTKYADKVCPQRKAHKICPQSMPKKYAGKVCPQRRADKVCRQRMSTKEGPQYADKVCRQSMPTKEGPQSTQTKNVHKGRPTVSRQSMQAKYAHKGRPTRYATKKGSAVLVCIIESSMQWVLVQSKGRRKKAHHPISAR